MHDERFRLGALPLDRTRTLFRLRAPSQRRVGLETENGDRFALEPVGDGLFEATLTLPVGTGYRYRIAHVDGEERTIADPASREQRGGFSVVVDPGVPAWQHDDWRGRPWHETVVCELDVRSLGGFDAAAERLSDLAQTGVTAVALTPVALDDDSRLPRLPFAPDPSFGRPDALRRLVDRAHGLGLTVLFGTVDTPFGVDAGSALDPDLHGRQAFFSACAVQWIVEYRADGLCLAAQDLPDDLAAMLRDAAGPHRRVHLLLADGAPLPSGFDARWNAEASRALGDLQAEDAASGVRRLLQAFGDVAGADADADADADAEVDDSPGADGSSRDAPAPATEVVGCGAAGESADAAALAVVLLSPQVPWLRDASAPSVRRLLRFRAERLVAHLPGARRAGARAIGRTGAALSWQLGDASRLVVACNVGTEPLAWPDAPAASHRVFGPAGDAAALPPGAAQAWLVPGLSAELAELAGGAGIALNWSDQVGRPQTVSRDTVARVLDALGHPCDSPQAIAASLAALDSAQGAPALRTVRLGESLSLPLPQGLGADGLRARLTLESGEVRELLPALREADSPGGAPTLSFDGFDTPGYHRLELVAAGGSHALGVAVAPPRAFDAGLERAWGTSVQLHALRPESGREGPDPGVGDLTALAAFAAQAGAAGAHVLAISPTHAGFAADATGFSPYSPSSRLFHNVFFIDPAAVFGAEPARRVAEAAGIDLAAAARPGPDALIDWPAAATLKLRWLRALFDQHRPELPSPTPDALRLHATFEALHAHFLAQGRFDWRQWPDAFQDPESAEVAAFAEAQADDVRFHTWLQHLAEAGLARAQHAARDAGMRVGLVSDLAIGMSGAGSHAWASRRDLLVGLEIGAPPDSMNPRGQSWGLTAFSPQALAERSFEPFLQTLRAAMRQTGGVRIDHVLGLNRLWLVPAGLPATEGAYVRYPLADFINLLILESHRQRAVVIGEDLGTVPDGFRDVLADAGVRGMAVLWLERTADGVGFRPPADWPADAVAMTTTHDLPTAAGWWAGRDIDWREKIGIEPDAAGARRRRESERVALAALAPEVDPAGSDGVDLAVAAVAAAPNALVLVPVEDLLGLVEQPNLPGTTTEHPNWRRRLPAAADRLLDAEPVRSRVERLRAVRGG